MILSGSCVDLCLFSAFYLGFETLFLSLRYWLIFFFFTESYIQCMKFIKFYLPPKSIYFFYWKAVNVGQIVLIESWTESIRSGLYSMWGMVNFWSIVICSPNWKCRLFTEVIYRGLFLIVPELQFLSPSPTKTAKKLCTASWKLTNTARAKGLNVKFT